MSPKQFYALGTACYIPTRTRNHNSYFLKWDKEGYLFDPGEGAQRQMTYAGVSVKDITKIFITHFHGDHCLGLPGVLQRLSIERVEHKVDVYFPASGMKYFNNLQNASIFTNTVAIEIHPIEKEGVIFSDTRHSISTKPLDHTVESWGYRIDDVDSVTVLPEKLKEIGIKGPLIRQLKETGCIHVNGKAVQLTDVSISKKGQSFAFVLDTRYCENAVSLAMDVDTLVSESTFMSEHEKEAVANGHLTAAHAAKIAAEANANLLVLTHFSKRYGDNGDFVQEAKEFFSNVVAVNDGDRLDIQRKRKMP